MSNSFLFFSARSVASVAAACLQYCSISHTHAHSTAMSLLRLSSRVQSRLSTSLIRCTVQPSTAAATIVQHGSCGAIRPSSLPSTLPTRSFSLRSGPSSTHSRPASFAVPAYNAVTTGDAGTKEWRMWMEAEGKRISVWHDIPLMAKGASHQQLLFNYVNEIPRGSDIQHL
jgi:hypothetical protein